MWNDMYDLCSGWQLQSEAYIPPDSTVQRADWMFSCHGRHIALVFQWYLLLDSICYLSVTFCPTAKHTCENISSEFLFQTFLCYEKLRLNSVLYSEMASVKPNFSLTVLHMFLSAPPISLLFAYSNIDYIFANTWTRTPCEIKWTVNAF
jgi:hypothetical protein